MTDELLRNALSAFADNRVDDTRSALVAAWRKRRSPVLARFVELLDDRWPDDLTTKLRTTITPRAADSLVRLEEIESVDDPRLARFAIDLLVQLPFSTPKAERLFEHLIDTVVRLRDVRLLECSKPICESMRVRLTRAPMRDALIERVENAAKAIAKRPPKSATDAERALEKQLDDKLGPLGASAKTAENFLAEIYGDPHNDDPRRVYADWLLERGDPRGEFIALQLQRRDLGVGRPAGPAPAEATAREKELLKRHGKAWLGSLASVISFGKGYARSTFERGFLCVADIIGSVGKKLEPLMTDPAWATVEEVDGSWSFELLERAPLRGLLRIGHNLDASSIQKLAQRTERLLAVQSISLPDLTDIDRALLLSAFPGLQNIELILAQPTLADVIKASNLGARRVTIHPHVGKSKQSTRAFETLVSSLEKEKANATAEELVLTPPYSSWPRPKPVLLRRQDDRYVRSRKGNDA